MCIRSDAPTEPTVGTTGWTRALSRRRALGDRQARAAPAAGDPVQPGRHRGADDRRRERLADAPVVARDDGPLVGAQRLAGHAHVAQVPETGVQPVDEGLAVDDARRRRRARRSMRSIASGSSAPGAPYAIADELGDRQRPAPMTTPGPRVKVTRRPRPAVVELDPLAPPRRRVEDLGPVGGLAEHPARRAAG